MAKTYLSFASKEEGSEAVDVLRAWRRDLLEHHRGERAALRRLDEPADCAFRPAFHDLRRRLAKFGEVNREALAVVAILAACLRTDSPGRSLPRRLRGDGDRPAFSELRLQRLVESDTPADILRQMRRALAVLDNEADLGDLAHWAYRLVVPGLHDHTARDLAYTYYGALEPAT